MKSRMKIVHELAELIDRTATVAIEMQNHDGESIDISPEDFAIDHHEAVKAIYYAIEGVLNSGDVISEANRKMAAAGSCSNCNNTGWCDQYGCGYEVQCPRRKYGDCHGGR